MMPKMTDISIKQWNQLSEVLVVHAVYDMTQTVINGGIMGKKHSRYWKTLNGFYERKLKNAI